MNVASDAPAGAGTIGPLATWRPQRLTIRARLTLTYAGLVIGCGAVLIGIVYLFMRYVPTYAIRADTTSANASARELPSLPAPVSATGSDTGTVPAISITSEADILNTILLASAIALVVLAIISGFVGWIVAGRAIKPLKLINEAATLAATGSLDHRIGLTGPHDEIRDLSTTFDDMLAKLDRAFQSHRRFAANASHELRTPLATTQTMIDVTLADPDADAAALRALARRIQHVNNANIQTVEALLDLATIDHGPLRWETADLRAITMEVMDTLTAEANEHRITLTLQAAAENSRRPTTIHTVDRELISCDPILVRQAVRNLIQNAIRHNVRDGTVQLRIECGFDTALIVTNTGAVVPADLLDTLLEPFVRGAGRTAGGGHGLGLAIATSIAQAHGGTLTLMANSAAIGGGLTATISLAR